MVLRLYMVSNKENSICYLFFPSTYNFLYFKSHVIAKSVEISDQAAL